MKVDRINSKKFSYKASFKLFKKSLHKLDSNGLTVLQELLQHTPENEYRSIKHPEVHQADVVATLNALRECLEDRKQYLLSING